MIELNYRMADIGDAKLYYNWVNDPLVRQNSFQQSPISFIQHLKWFNQKLKSRDCHFYLFFNLNNAPVGQVRIDKANDEIIIGLSIDEFFRGKGLGITMINMACSDYGSVHPNEVIVAYIKSNNISSIKVFEKAGFINPQLLLINQDPAYRLTRELI